MPLREEQVGGVQVKRSDIRNVPDMVKCFLFQLCFNVTAVKIVS